MKPQIAHALGITLVIVGQTLLLAAGAGFLAAVIYSAPLPVPFRVATIMYSNPSETTFIISLVATILSGLGTLLLSIAFKKALGRRMYRSISLVHLSSGIALIKNSYLLNRRHKWLTLVTLVVFGLTKLLVSSWTALLEPITVTCNPHASGWELDLTSDWFESQLEQELVRNGAALVKGNSTEIIDFSGLLSGITAAQNIPGTNGVFDFNGVQYNMSTGGVLPAAPSYNGISTRVSGNNTGLSFIGGLVPTRLNVHFRKCHTETGLAHNYTLQQQGLTAHVACSQVNGPASDQNITSTVQPIPVPLLNGTTDYWLWAWNITADCNEGVPSQQQYVTRSNSSTVPLNSTGLVYSLVCPYPLQQTGFNWERFTVFTSGNWKYSFFPLTVCEIQPLVTTSTVTYANGMVNASMVDSRPLGSGNANLTRFLAAMASYQGKTTQGLYTNAFGDSLYTTYVSALGDAGVDVTTLISMKMEQYWQGVIEFAGTYLRSGFSVYPQNIPADALIPTSGYETITTMGWYRRSQTYGYSIISITIVALVTYAAVVYALWHAYTQRKVHNFREEFDPSDPIHLMMTSAAKDANGDKGNLDESLAGFEDGGMGKNENVMIQLMDLAPHRKRFRVTST